MPAVITVRIISGIKNHHDAVTLVKGKQNSIMKPLFSDMACLKLVDYKLDEMRFVPVEFQPGGYLLYLTVNAGMEKTLSSQLLEKLLVMTLAPLYYRGKDIYLFTVIS